jgi:glucokinase
MVNEERRAELAVVVDVGGTKIAAALADRQGHVTHKMQVATAHTDAQAVVDQILDLIRKQLDRAARPVVGVGVAVPAVVDPASGFVHWAPNLPGWRELPLGAILQDATKLPSFVDYDGHLAVLGEYWRGAGRGARHVIFLILGTGVGGGLILNGRIHRGRDNIAGAAGWMVVDPSVAETPMACSLGCLESLASGPAIVAAAEQRLARGEPSSLRGQPVTPAAVFAAAEAGDPLAKEVVRRAAQALGCAVASLVSVLNPDVVILGGGVGLAAPAFLEAARSAVARYAQPIGARSVRVVTAALGDDAILIGAARFVFDRLRGPQMGHMSTYEGG